MLSVKMLKNNCNVTTSHEMSMYAVISIEETRITTFLSLLRKKMIKINNIEPYQALNECLLYEIVKSFLT